MAMNLYVGGHQPMFRPTSFDIDASRLFARMQVQPDRARKLLIDKTIRDLKSAGLWEKLEFFHMMAAHDAQAALLDWKNNGFDLTAANSPAFTADKGFTGDSTAAHLIGPDWPTPKPENLGIGAWEFTNVTSYSTAGPASNSAIYAPMIYNLVTLSGVPSVWARIHGDDQVRFPLANPTSVGLTTAQRVDSTTLAAYRNGVSLGIQGSADISRYGGAVSYLRVSNNYSGRSVSCGFAYDAVIDEETQGKVFEALKDYMEGVGNV